MNSEVHILVYCPIDTLQWGWTHSAMHGLRLGTVFAITVMCHKISAEDLLVSSQGNTTPYMKGYNTSYMRYESVIVR